jgi:hypothetical protein
MNCLVIGALGAAMYCFGNDSPGFGVMWIVVALFVSDD